jgi:ligand-binding sensor domain-containing protein/signal transduction histidine kinase
MNNESIRHRILQALLLLILSGWQALSRAADLPASLSEEYVIKHWELEDGLPDSTVTAILQSRDGYLWMGTTRGLARFDGSRFKVFDSETAPSFPNGPVHCLNEDSLGRLWVGFDNGAVLRQQGGSFEMLMPESSSQTNFVNSITFGPQGEEWISLAVGKIMHRVNGNWMSLEDKDGFTRNGEVACLGDNTGKVWFTTADAFGYVKGEHVEPLIFHEGYGFHLLKRRSGGMWLAGGPSLSEFSGENALVTASAIGLRSGSSDIQTLYEDRKGELWVGTTGQGLFRFAAGAFTKVLESPDYIMALCEDNEGNLWVGSRGGGLFRLRRRLAHLHNSTNGLPSDGVDSIAQTSDGAMWFVCGTAGITRVIDGFYTTYNATNGWPLPLPAIMLCPDRDDGIWIGSRGGLIHWRDGTFSSAGLDGRRVRGLFRDHKGVIFSGAPGKGLVSIDGGKTTEISGAGCPQDVTAISEDAAGNLWLGTLNGTIHLREGESFRRFDRASGMPGQTIQAIVADGTNSIWAATRGGGLIGISHDQVHRITRTQGLVDDLIRQLIADDRGNLWVGSSRGIFRVKIHDLDEVVAGRLAAVSCVSYGRADGMAASEFSPGHRNATCRTRDGHFWFATASGALEVDPAALTAETGPPKVVIEEVNADGPALPASGAHVIEIPPSTRQVEIQYATLSFANPEQVRFRYKLGDLNADWIPADTGRKAVFIKLPPGDHDFWVTAANREGNWDPVGAFVRLRVQAAWWQTKWARATAFVLIIAPVAIVIRFMANRRLRRQLRTLEHEQIVERERTRIAKDMHDELGAELTRIGLIGQQVRRDSLLPRDTAARVEKLCDAAREVSQTLDQIVWAVNPGNDTLERLVGYLSEYALEFVGPTSARLRQELAETVPAREVTAEVRHNFFLSFKEALNNAVKHSQASEIELRVAVTEGALVVKVVDNGRGFSPAEANPAGNGLPNLAGRMKSIGGHCHIDGQPGKGTMVTLTLPLERCSGD